MLKGPARGEVTLQRRSAPPAYSDRACAAACADYEQRLLALSAELTRSRDDMAQRMVYMTREMQRYQAAALATAAAMTAAKKEMGERRRDVDTMRVKMDSLMERLLVGHEANATLQATLGVGQEHAGASLRAAAAAAAAASECALLPCRPHSAM